MEFLQIMHTRDSEDPDDIIVIKVSRETLSNMKDKKIEIKLDNKGNPQVYGFHKKLTDELVDLLETHETGPQLPKGVVKIEYKTKCLKGIMDYYGQDHYQCIQCNKKDECQKLWKSKQPKEEKK